MTIGNAVSISHTQRCIRGGRLFFVKNWTIVTDKDTEFDILFVAPDVDTKIYAQAAIAAEAGFSVDFYVNVVTSDDGAPEMVNNAKFTSTKTPVFAVYNTPVITDIGDLRWRACVGSEKDTMGSLVTNYDIEVKMATKYLLRFKKMASGSHYIDYFFRWTEE
jgi:hypothetical protein